MTKHSVRKIISDQLWKHLEAAVAAAKHSPAGAPPKLTDREFLEALLHLNRTGSPWRDLPAELGYWHAVTCASGAGKRAESGSGLWQNLQAEPFAQSARFVSGFDHGARASACRGRAKKNGPDQALGRSRGGLAPRSTRRPSTKTARSPCT